MSLIDIAAGTLIKSWVPEACTEDFKGTSSAFFVQKYFDIMEPEYESEAADLLHAAAVELSSLCRRCEDGKIPAEDKTTYGVLAFAKEDDAKDNANWRKATAMSRTQFKRCFTEVVSTEMVPDSSGDNSLENTLNRISEGSDSDDDDKFIFG